MSNVIDLSFLAEKLEADVRSIIMDEVRETCIEALKEIIKDTVYSNPARVYQRTMGFLNAVDVIDLSIGATSATFMLTVDPSKIAPLIPAEAGAPENPKARWGKHMLFNGNPFTTGLVKALDQGFSNKYYVRKGAKFFDKTKIRLEDEIPNIMRAALSARGWEVF